jgi:alanyl-tRNA synthetase
MSDENTTPPEGTPPAAPPAQDADGKGKSLVDLIKADPERTAKEIEELRKEAQKLRKERTALEEKQKSDEDAKLVEQNKFKELAESRAAEIQKLKEERRQDAIRAAVRLEAAKLKFIDPEDAMVDAVLSKVKADDNGVTGVTEALTEYVTAKPYLIFNGQPSNPKLGATNPGGGPRLTSADLKKMSQNEIAALTDDQVAAALKL